MTFTKDGELVCRHDQCDLHTTTNILLTPLAKKCTKGFSPAEFGAFIAAYTEKWAKVINFAGAKIN